MSQHLTGTGARGAAVDGAERFRAAGGEGHGEGNGIARRHPELGCGAPRGTPGGERRGRDATVDALEALTRALEEISKDRRLLEERLAGLHRRRAEGRAWREILAEEDTPGTMQLVSRMLACLAAASGTLRKELVEDLRGEGVSIPAIAKLFGVTHQRVSNLLRRPAG